MVDSKTPSDQGSSGGHAADTATAERGRVYRTQKQEIASLEADLVVAKADVETAQAALAAAEVDLADLRAQAAVSDAQHAGELATLQAIADERSKQIDTLRADLAEARKAPVAAAQAPQKRERRPTSAEKFDPDVLHQEVLAKWFKYMDEHPNDVPPEERTRRIVRQLVAESKARDAAAPTPPEVQGPAPEAPEAPVAGVESTLGWRGHLRLHKPA